MRIVVAPGSFKGSIISLGACNTISRILRNSFPSADIRKVVVADGGEGTLETFVVNFGAQLRTGSASDSLGRTIKARFAMMGSVAIVQSCETVGVSLLGEEELDPLRASSKGVGEQIRDAIGAGARTILVTMGDSATMDFGLGLMAELGTQWLDHRGASLDPLIENADRICDVDMSATNRALEGIELQILFDTYDYFCGDFGQVGLYGAQKGLRPSDATYVEYLFREFARFISGRWGVDLAAVEGSSGSGGIAGTMHAMLGAKLHHTLGYLDERLGMRDLLGQADVAITGEGCLDYQTKFGKVPQFVSEWAGNRCYHVVGEVTPEGASALEGAARARFVTLNPSLDPRHALRDAATEIAASLAAWGAVN
ncbi:MAG TPA: glycerate kinase [Allosphingosinicella sp.]|nr:glycerate kinase [Allosphingosinicella sp.]